MQLKNDFVLYLAVSLALFGIGVMFLAGFWRRQESWNRWLWSKVPTWIRRTGTQVPSKAIFESDPDDSYFADIKDRRTLKAGDQLAFVICTLTAICTLLNGMVSLSNPSFPNVSAPFLLIGFFLIWPIRMIFIRIYKSKDYEQVPRIWPFSRIK